MHTIWCKIFFEFQSFPRASPNERQQSKDSVTIIASCHPTIQEFHLRYTHSHTLTHKDKLLTKYSHGQKYIKVQNSFTPETILIKWCQYSLELLQVWSCRQVVLEVMQDGARYRFPGTNVRDVAWHWGNMVWSWINHFRICFRGFPTVRTVLFSQVSLPLSPLFVFTSV